MSEPDIVAQLAGPVGALVGPIGALVGAATAAATLWRRHLRDVDARIASGDAALSYERSRTSAAEDRLASLGETLKGAADVMEKSVLTTDKVVELLRESLRGE